MDRILIKKGSDHFKLLRTWRVDEQIIPLVEKISIYKYCSNLEVVNASINLISFMLKHYKSGVFELGSYKMVLGVEDIYFITGLPLSGRPVVYSTLNVHDACQRLLGRTAPDGNSYALKLAWLKETFMEVRAGATMNEKIYHARALVLFYLGCAVFPSQTFDVPLELLCLLEDVSACDDYAWGAACYANIGSALNHLENLAKDPKKRLPQTLHCSTFILEVFFLEHLPSMALELENQLHRTLVLPTDIPLGVGWSELLQKASVNGFFDFDTCKINQFHLRPYLRLLPVNETVRTQYAYCGGSYPTIYTGNVCYYSHQRCAAHLGLPVVDDGDSIPSFKYVSRKTNPFNWTAKLSNTIAQFDVRPFTFGLPWLEGEQDAPVEDEDDEVEAEDEDEDEHEDDPSGLAFLCNLHGIADDDDDDDDEDEGEELPLVPAPPQPQKEPLAPAPPQEQLLAPAPSQPQPQQQRLQQHRRVLGEIDVNNILESDIKRKPKKRSRYGICLGRNR